MAAITSALLTAKLATALADVLSSRINKRAKKMDVLRATLAEVASQLIGLEGRIARVEKITGLLDMDQDGIPDSLEALVEARQKDVKNSGLQLL